MTTSRRRWLQFRLRTLFLLVAVCAVPCGLFKWKWDRKQAERRAVAEIKQAGGHASYDWQMIEGNSASANRLWRLKQGLRPEPPGPAFLRKLLGDDFVAHVVYVSFASVTRHGPSQIDDEPLRWLESLPDLEMLSMVNSNVSDAGLEHLQGLSRLRWLVMDQTKVTGAGLRHVKQAKDLRTLSLQSLPITDADLTQLAAFPELEELNLNFTRITDAGLIHLTNLPKLHTVWLSFTAVDDEGLQRLSRFPKLRRVSIQFTPVTDAGVANLKAAIPGITISGVPQRIRPLFQP